jgi:hypothetical protein
VRDAPRCGAWTAIYARAMDRTPFVIGGAEIYAAL